VERSTFKQGDKIGFDGFLQSADSARLESQICLEILSDFTNETLEGQFANEQFCGFLVATNFSESDCTRTVTMGFLDTSRCLEHVS